ncbi:MAG: O-antigen ligase domain-containing protein [Mycetocola sp.]
MTDDRLLPDLPAWPVLILLWGMAVWWAIGLLPFYMAIMSLVMIAFLLQRGRVEIVPGVFPYVAFVVWMLPCALMLDSFARLLGYGVRFAQFAAIAVILVYVVNARRLLTPARILAGLSAVWAFVIVGGYLGMIWPAGELTFTVGRLLPESVLANEYVSDLMFPKFAEIQNPWGAAEPFLRPSAPFAYTNGWGAAIAILTPIAVANAIALRTAKATIWLIIGIALSIPPSIATTNRGLFVGLAIVVAYVLLRLLFQGKWLPLFWLAFLGFALAVVLILSGLLEGIIARQETVNTTEGRSGLYEETFERTLQSPLFGYGAPRPSFTSEISAGTQGMVWNVMFSFGFVGLGLFVLFLVGGLIRTWAAPNVSTLWLHASLICACVMSVFYGLDRHLLPIVLVLGLLLRERYAPSSDYWTPNPRPLGRRHAH